jgi:N utilization substance protein A
MKVNVLKIIKQLSKERGVDTDVIVNAIKESLKVASSNYFANNEEVTINFDPKNGELRVFTVKKISKNPKDPGSEISLSEAKKIDVAASYGNCIEIDLPSKTLGRIAAQATKQVILKKVKNAEQEKIYVFFASKLGEIVSGVLRRFGPNHSIIFESNKTEILLPVRETLPGETFVRGDRIKASVIRVLRETYGPQVIVSRTDNIFLAKLMEKEIPEIANGNIEIKDIVRQPGERAKIAVLAKEKDIDPIGACIGLRGNRILSIRKELFGEKIDVIEWSDDPTTYAKSALNPAKVDSVSISNKKDKILKANVSRDQFSLAIGKKGTNVRLASRLTGWKIEINSE